jgi:hypothetical protein
MSKIKALEKDSNKSSLGSQSKYQIKFGEYLQNSFQNFMFTSVF